MIERTTKQNADYLRGMVKTLSTAYGDTFDMDGYNPDARKLNEHLALAVFHARKLFDQQGVLFNSNDPDS